MKAFIYKGEFYIRCIPGKNLFRSTMVHEVVNRGDIFAMRVSDQQLTIISGAEDVEHREVGVITEVEEFDKLISEATLLRLQMHAQKIYDELQDKPFPFIRTHAKALMKLLESV